MKVWISFFLCIVLECVFAYETTETLVTTDSNPNHSIQSSESSEFRYELNRKRERNARRTVVWARQKEWVFHKPEDVEYSLGLLKGKIRKSEWRQVEASIRFWTKKSAPKILENKAMSWADKMIRELVPRFYCGQDKTVRFLQADVYAEIAPYWSNLKLYFLEESLSAYKQARALDAPLVVKMLAMDLIFHRYRYSKAAWYAVRYIFDAGGGISPRVRNLYAQAMIQTYKERGEKVPSGLLVLALTAAKSAFDSQALRVTWEELQFQQAEGFVAEEGKYVLEMPFGDKPVEISIENWRNAKDLYGQLYDKVQDLKGQLAWEEQYKLTYAHSFRNESLFLARAEYAAGVIGRSTAYHLLSDTPQDYQNCLQSIPTSILLSFLDPKGYIFFQETVIKTLGCAGRDANRVVSSLRRILEQAKEIHKTDKFRAKKLREWSVAALAMFGTDAQVAIKEIIQLYNDASPDGINGRYEAAYRAKLLHALGKIGGKEAFNFLIKALGNHWDSYDAKKTLIQMGANVVEELLKLVLDAQLGDIIFDILRQIDGKALDDAVRKRLVGDPNRPILVRLLGLLLFTNNPNPKPLVLNILKASTNPNVIIAAAKTLYALGGPKAVETLRSLLKQKRNQWPKGTTTEIEKTIEVFSRPQSEN